MRHKYAYVFLAIFLISFSTLRAQPYVIDDYHVAIEIKSDGYVLVNETIEVDFTEKRRGIFREIPTTYKNSSASGEALIIDQIHVANDPFVVMHESGMVRIRIGAPDVFVSGKKTYQISYLVLGAVEQFENWAEFSWDIIGDRWDTKIKQASAEIQFPYPIVNPDADLLVFKGRNKIVLNPSNHQLTSSKIGLEIDETFRSGTGLSLAMRFREHEFPIQKVPAAIISEYFYVNRADLHFDVQTNGEVHVSEDYQIRLKAEQAYLVRKLAASGYPSATYGRLFPFPDLINGQRDQQAIQLNMRNTEIDYRIGCPLTRDRTDLHLNYLMYGSVVEDEQVKLHLDAANFEGRVAVDTLALTISLPSQVNIVESPKLPGYKLVRQDANTFLFVRSGFLVGEKNSSVSLTGLSPEELVYPRECLFSTVITDQLKLKINLMANGRAEIEEEVIYSKKLGNDVDEFSIGCEVDKSDFPFSISNFNILNNRTDFDIKPMEAHPDFKQSDCAYRSTTATRMGSNRFYSTYQTDYKYVDGQFITPIYSLQNGPIDRVAIQIVSIDHEEVFSDHWSENYRREIGQASQVFHFEDDGFVAVPLDATALPSTSFLFNAGRFIRGNGYLFFSFLFCGLLYVLWYLFGRDIPYRGELSSEPPAYMTPAEAGYLWDGRLHGRDMISLIYHWAARGHLLIEEVDKAGKPDYILEKVSDLPSSAMTYEHILFDKLFEHGQNRVRISAMRESFYSTMTKARKALKEEFENRHFYRRWTRGLGLTFLILGCFVLVIGLVALGIGIVKGNMTFGLPTSIIGVALVVFGYLLPQKTVLGSKFFHALKSFDAFMDVAKPAQLKALYESDSRYFQNTLAYAIVLGKAKEWAARFDSLITEPPTYYRGHRYDHFSTIIFTDMVISGMRRMESDLYSMPAPSGGSGSFSGGGSSSFGGGFSGGGGFGGGGGSSW